MIAKAATSTRRLRISTRLRSAGLLAHWNDDALRAARSAPHIHRYARGGRGQRDSEGELREPPHRSAIRASGLTLTARKEAHRRDVAAVPMPPQPRLPNGLSRNRQRHLGACAYENRCLPDIRPRRAARGRRRLPNARPDQERADCDRPRGRLRRATGITSRCARSHVVGRRPGVCRSRSCGRSQPGGADDPDRQSNPR